MQLERAGHEILSVEEIKTPTQNAIVRRHYTMYAHVHLEAPNQASVGEEVTLTARLAKWDDGATVTDYLPTLTVAVDGDAVAEVDLVKGEAGIPLQFTDPGTYMIEVGCPTVQPATVTIEVVGE